MSVSWIFIEICGQGFYEFMDQVELFVCDVNCDEGLVILFVWYIFCFLIIQENVDLDVWCDLDEFFWCFVLLGNDFLMCWLWYMMEGLDDMFVYIKVVLNQILIGILVIVGWMGFGIWQGLYLFEYCDQLYC